MSFMKEYDEDSLNKINRLFNQIENETYGLPRENLEAMRSVPMKGNINKGALTYTYKFISELGYAKVIASNAKDLPPVSRAYRLETVGIKNVGDCYSFTQDEIDAMLYAGMNLEADDANTARRKIDEKIDEIIMIGDEENGLLGLLNNPNVPLTTIDNGAGGKTTWADKTFDEIKDDIQAMLDTVFENNKGARGGSTFNATDLTLKLPRKTFISLTTRYRNDQNNTTFLDALKSLFAPQGIANWEACNDANEIGVGKTGRALLYKKSLENLFSIVPVPFRILPAQYVGLSVIYNCVAKTGGTVWRRPTTATYADGV